MTGDAEVIEAHHAVVPVVLTARRDPAEEVGHLRKLRHAGADARERVGRVVDDDRYGQLVERRRLVRVSAHRLMVPDPAPDGLVAVTADVLAQMICGRVLARSVDPKGARDRQF